MTKATWTAFAAFSILALPAVGQSSPLEYESSLEAVAVLSPGDDTDGGARTEDALFEFSFDNRVKKVLPSGLQISGRLTLRGQNDHSQRPGFAGNFGGGLGPAGGYSGLSSSSPGLDVGARGALEAAYIQFDGGYGELRLGLDRGVAARFYEGAPSALTHARTNNPYLDPDGIKILRTNHDLTGPSAKISYATPRILGVRAGVSVTPDAESRGLDRDTKISPVQPELSNAVELAANVSRRLRSPDLRIDASLAWSTASIDSPFPTARDSVETWSAGTQLEFSNFTVGASWLSSNNGFDSADYEAWEVGAGFDLAGNEITINYGEAEDDLAVLSSEAFGVAIARDISDELRLALGWQDETLQTATGTRAGAGFVVEITLSSDFFAMTGN